METEEIIKMAINEIGAERLSAAKDHLKRKIMQLDALRRDVKDIEDYIKKFDINNFKIPEDYGRR